MDDLQNRRAFLRAAIAAGVGWAAADLAQVEEALAWAATQTAARSAAAARNLQTFSAVQADVVDAVASRIVPAVDGRPGAHEAGAIFFIDRALATFNASQKQPYLAGIADLNRRAGQRAAGARSFAALAADQQDAILHDVETTPFFQAVRFDTIVGTFALPTWGGNREYAGWHLLGFEHQPRFQAPFGYYDADANGRA